MCAEAPPDHQLDRVYPDAQPLVLWDGIGDSAAAIGQLRVEVHPLPRGGLGHDVYVHLGGETKMHINTALIAYITRHTVKSVSIWTVVLFLLCTPAYWI